VVDGGGGDGVNGSKKACNLHPQDIDTLVIIIILLLLLLSTFMQGICNYVLETICVYRVYSVAAIL